MNGALVNLYLVAIQVFDGHTAENTFNMTYRFLTALCCVMCKTKLLSTSTDGEKPMTGRRAGVVTRLAQAAEYPIVPIWCEPHQIDIFIKGAAALSQDGLWIATV